MITINGIEITRETAKYKFGGNPMAEFLWQLSLDSGEDDSYGDGDLGIWFALFGKRILCSDEQGFVWIDKYPNEAEALRDFNEMVNDHEDVYWAERLDAGF